MHARKKAIIALIVGAMIGLGVEVYLHGYWYGPGMSQHGTWDPPMANPNYQTLKLTWEIIPPAAAGFIGGLLASMLASAAPFKAALGSALLQIVVVSFYWMSPSISGSREWRLLIVMLPVGGSIGALLVLGIRRRLRASKTTI